MKKYKKVPLRIHTAKKSTRLGAYLAAGLGASTVVTPTVDAAIICIDVSSYSGINGGLAPGTGITINDWPFNGAGIFEIYNGKGSNVRYGFDGDGGLTFAITGGYASPKNFAANDSIDNTSVFSSSADNMVFKGSYNGGYQSPDFGSGSYMGFRTNTGNYGWLEVTWNSASTQFQILAGAYESVVGASILAGDSCSAAVPEPSTWAMSALLSGGVAFTVWRRRRATAQAKPQAA